MDSRQLDPLVDGQFFDPDEQPMDADLKVIRPLTESSAPALWSDLVSAVPSERHPMLLPAGHWLRPLWVAGLDWSEVWSSPRADSDPVVAALDAHLPWRPEQEVVFIWARERAVTAPWATFRRTWRAFLFEDEGPFLIAPGLPQVAVFSPSGQIGFCARPLP